MLMVKEPHMALFGAPTGVGKTRLALDLIEKEYKNYFNFIIIICLTLHTAMRYTANGNGFGPILTSFI